MHWGRSPRPCRCAMGRRLEAASCYAAAGESTRPPGASDKSAPMIGLPRVSARNMSPVVPSSDRIEGGAALKTATIFSKQHRVGLRLHFDAS